jgi:DNA-binding CsgD family transcriptional regulator
VQLQQEAIEELSLWKWQRSREAEHARELALDSLATAVFAIDANAEVIFANTKGEAELRSGTWLALDGRVLKATTKVAEHQKFNSRLQQLVLGHGFAMQLHCSKLRSTVTVCGAFHSANRARQWSGPMGLIWIIDTGVDAVALSLATEIFKLSPAEAKLLRHLRDGLPLKEAALVVGVKESTARAQLQSIFTKTGRRRQSELIALLERLALLRSDHNQSPQ